MSKSKKFDSQIQIKKLYKKFKSDLCDDNMTFHDCELEILRNAVDESEIKKGVKNINNDEIKQMLKIVEDFLIRKKLVCYGGTAINNILPKFAQFYNRDIEIPDYDFYSSNALEDSKELADIYFKAGYTDVEAKAGVHMGTFKVFVNFIPIADITQLNKMIFESISRDSIKIAGIYYAPPDFLRMAMYLELSRPDGDVSRWEKVFKRLSLLNKHYPIKTNSKCNTIDFQRKSDLNSDQSEKLYISTRNSLIDQGVIFFGGYATSLYSKYMSDDQKHIVKKIPDFDVLSEEPNKCATILKESLEREGFKKISIINHDPIGEIIPYHVEIQVGKSSIAYIYKPIACHSYNKIIVDNNEINVATIDTILAFYLSFLYIDNKNYNKDRLLCMAKFLFNVEDKNRLAQIGLLKRFSLDCYGKQMTLEDIRSEKALKYKELSKERGSKEYQMWFLKYVPSKLEKNKEITEKEMETNKKDSIHVATILESKKKNRKNRKNKTQKVSIINFLKKKKTQKQKGVLPFF
uniref:Poly(A) polymerase catalytic subunit domain-containing protein n=1 Tax=viral metagenome TaxID=1070528 RepID=A0A6C0JK40_9ZZZZ